MNHFQLIEFLFQFSMFIYAEWSLECLSFFFGLNSLFSINSKNKQIYSFSIGLACKNIRQIVTIHPFSFSFRYILFTTSHQFWIAAHRSKWTCDRSIFRYSIFGQIQFWNWNNKTSFETDHQAKFRGAISWACLFSSILLQMPNKLYQQMKRDNNSECQTVDWKKC